MIVVIIAGGSGTRLWPLSTHSYPKHLLKLTNEFSLLQNTYNRVKNIADEVFVVSEVSHIEHVYDQLSELNHENVLVEPSRKGTASCFILALSEIKRRQLADQPVAFLWADNLIRDNEGFSVTMQRACNLAEDLKSLIFIGVEPSYPATIFGYMEKGDRLDNGLKDVYKLNKFVEKPDKSTAVDYYQSGKYLWNTGYLVGNISTFDREINETNQELWENYQALIHSTDINATYGQFENEVIDIALSERVKDAIVIPATFDWMDVGSFQDLHSASLQDNEGNHKRGEKIEMLDTTNSFVRNESDKTVAVIGLDNVAVIANENGILVLNKTHAPKVGEVAKKVQGS